MRHRLEGFNYLRYKCLWILAFLLECVYPLRGNLGLPLSCWKFVLKRHLRHDVHA